MILPSCECDRNAPLTPFELGTLLAVVGLLSLLSGCKAFYENSGSNLAVGEITAPVEFSEPSESLTIRCLFNMTGAKVWTAKDALVKVTYRNAYTNSYLFGMADKVGVQDFDVSVEPLEVTPQVGESATAPTASQPLSPDSATQIRDGAEAP